MRIRTKREPRATPLSVALAVVPVICLTFAIPLVNRVQPQIAGMPLILVWICGWILLTPLFLWGTYKVEGRG